jgi:rfaE bifunctional protein kinase chain/domain
MFSFTVPESEAGRMLDQSSDDLISKLQRVGSESVVFVSGNFNVLHIGHFRLLKFAAEQGRLLVVGVNPDGTPGVSIPAAMRLESLRSIDWISEAFLLQEPVEAFVARLKPAVVVKGKEFEHRHNPEKSILDSYGGKLVFNSGEAIFSSVALLRSEFQQFDPSTISLPQDFPARKGFNMRSLKADLARIAGMRVLVVGDLIVDEYVNCEPLGMSQEDPTIVVTPIDERLFVGGAGIVAAHAHSLGGEVRFVSVVGGDRASDFARKQLEQYGVAADWVVDSTRPTTHKQRFRARGSTLLRVTRLRSHPIDPNLGAAMLAAVDGALDKTDLLLFADYNYGCLPQTMVDEISARARSRGVMMTADSQASSQMADVSRFKGMTLLTPTEREARLALRDPDSGLSIVAERLCKIANARHVVITLGADGMLLYIHDGDEYRADRLPAFNSAPKDVSGAGDAFLTCASMSMCADIDPWRSVYLGALAAACQVGRLGNTPLTTAELAAELEYGRH